MAFLGTWKVNAWNFRSKLVFGKSIGNQWPKLAHRTTRKATSWWQRGVLGEYSWRQCESFVKNVDTLFMLLWSLKTLCSSFWRFTLSSFKQFTIFPTFSGWRILATSLPTRAPLWYTCLFKFILSSTPSNLLWKGPFKLFFLATMVVNCSLAAFSWSWCCFAWCCCSSLPFLNSCAVSLALQLPLWPTQPSSR